MNGACFENKPFTFIPFSVCTTVLANWQATDALSTVAAPELFRCMLLAEKPIAGVHRGYVFRFTVHIFCSGDRANNSVESPFAVRIDAKRLSHQHRRSSENSDNADKNLKVLLNSIRWESICGSSGSSRVDNELWFAGPRIEM